MRAACPELVVENPLDEARAALRRRGARRREAEPHPQRERARRRRASKLRSPSRASSRAAGAAHRPSFDSALHISHAHLRRRKAETQAAQPLARGVAQGEVWDELHEKADAHVRRLADRRQRGPLPRLRAPTSGELEDAFPLQPGQCGAVLATRRRPLRRRRLAPGRVRATLAEAAGGLPARRARAARRRRGRPRARSAGSWTRSPRPQQPGSPRPVSARTCACAASA